MTPYRSALDRIAVAPMMDHTDRHCRYLLRLLHPTARLYTEMITAHALVHGDASRLLAFDAAEHPVALQIGGADPRALGRAAQLGAAAGYDEINLNVGCPSDRVQSGRFGACLMAEPAVVADGVRSMLEAVPARVAVTVKCRIGIDDRDDFGFLESFVAQVRAAGVDVFIVHARKAILQGLSPKQNREIPPLRYDVPLRLKQEHPELTVVLNGGLRTVGDVEQWLPRFDGVMLGRQAYQEPYLLAELHSRLDGPGTPLPPRSVVLASYADYVDRQLAAGQRLSAMLRHVLGLYSGQPNARAWRRYVVEQAARSGADGDVLRRSTAMFTHAAAA